MAKVGVKELITWFIFAEQSFIIFMTREDHMAGLPYIYTQLISCQPIIQIDLIWY